MRKSEYIFALILVFFSVHLHAQQAPVIKLKAEKLHARVREWPYPINGITVSSNAPALTWPATNGTKTVLPMESGSTVPDDPNIGNVRYQVMLASDKQFSKNLIQSNIQAWAVYPLHQALKPGRWYWKYGYALKGTNKWTWSPVYDFVVDAKYANAKVSPPVSEVLKRNGGPHPRLWMMHKNAEDFYNNNMDNPAAKRFVAAAEKLMAEPLPVEKPMRYIDTTGKTALEKEKIIERMYHGFGDFVGTPISQLCIAYWLTKDQRFILDAKRRALNAVQMHPDSLATHDDFTSGAILEALGWFYDAGYMFLNEQEKELFKKNIRLRGKRVYDHLPNRFELHVSDNHVWQITMRNLAIATVAAVNDVPEATEWLTYLYEVWSARFPVLGTTDGGWHEGNGYFKVNFKSIIYLSQMFGDFSGVDYFQLPWMQNLPYYMLYTYPPASGTTAYGDMWENSSKMERAQGIFAKALSYKINNPFLNQYVAQIEKDNPEFFKRPTDDYTFFGLLNYKPQQKWKTASFSLLPKSRTFTDVGVAAMHSDLSNTASNLSVYLMSNPFGSSGHGSASQNAITINYKGKTIFGGSGYYSNFSDRHNLLHYRTSRAYSTILADSLSQKLGEEGYGWIPRSISGQAVQYALGDASNAYGNIKSSFWQNRFDLLELDPLTTGVYGDAGVTLYRRHTLQLEGGVVVLYDELEAKQAVKWTSQFHSPYYTIIAGKTKEANHQQFDVQTNLGNVSTDIFANSAISLSVHNKFSEPAVNWAKVNDGDGNIKEFKEQWHAGITSLPLKKFRFLTLIQIKGGKIEVIKKPSEKEGSTLLEIGRWKILAQLNPGLPATLQVSDEFSFFNYGNLPFSFRGKEYKPSVPGSSMLIEFVNGQLKKQEVTDKLPDVVKDDSPEK